jgi:hypothetical protein
MSATTATPPQGRDRLQYLLSPANTSWNGIDYVEIASRDQRLLRVHFLTTVPVAPAAGADPLSVDITGGETIPTVTVVPASLAWSVDTDARPLLTLYVAAPGDFSTYTLTITGSPALDPYFDSIAFSFKANCTSEYDCATPAPGCPEDEAEPVAINYLAKDFSGFIQALSDFSALRYPNWVERSEADIGVVLMEALSALADELSYYQDRVAAEASITTATQRVSLVRHARLVDYEPAAARAATTQLQLEVAGPGLLPAGLRCSALGADGTQIPFEVGDGLISGTGPYQVNPAWNAQGSGGIDGWNLAPYWWDESQQCLVAGATTLWLLEHGHELAPGVQLLIDTVDPTGANAPIRELVTIATATETEDPVFSVAVTELTLAAPTTLDHDLSQTHCAGNIVPAIHGARMTETFVIPAYPRPDTPPEAPGPPAAVVRTGANWTPSSQVPQYLYTLAAPQISWTALPPSDDDGNASVALEPQILLSSASPGGASSAASGGTGTQAWTWQTWLLDSAADDFVFTLTPERYSNVGGAGEVAWFEYDGEGVTIRFGDGTCGLIPEQGTVYTVTYLAGGGSIGNVPAGTIISLDPVQPAPAGSPAAPAVTASTNPFPATGGADEETAQQIVDRAPQAFRAQPLRVVRPADYVATAQGESWVQQAGTTFRWTGSWMTAFTSANPVAEELPTDAQIEDLSDLLNRRRLSGYESYVLAPQYVSVDLRIRVAAASTDFASSVAAAVLAQLQPGSLPGGGVGFFDHSRWGFGQALDPSALLAAIQGAPGVVGVVAVQYRERGVQPLWAPLAGPIAVPADRLLRVDNDPSRPEAGSLSVSVEGGK